MVGYGASAKRGLLYLGLTAAFLLPLFSSAATAPTFARNHQLWDIGSDILALQQWLNQNGYSVAQSGPGSPAHETDFFGLRTYHALLEFQATHHLPATGFFGPLTRAAISTSPSNPPSSTSNPPSPQFSTTPLPGYAPGQIILGGGGSSNTNSGGVGGSTSDSTPPSPPTNLSATAISSSQIDLSWTASNDNGGGDAIAGYKIFRGGTYVGTTTSGTTYDDTSLSADTTYTYVVQAYDAAGNVSSSSASANAITQVAPYNRASYVGMNLTGVAYYSTEQPFLDIFKTGFQGKITSLINGWITLSTGTGAADTHEEQYLQLDSNGWPTSLIANGEGGSQTFNAVGVLLLNGQPSYPTGHYVVLYQGQGTLNFQFDATLVSTSTGRDIINVATPTGEGFLFEITSTDPNHNGNYLRNIQVVYSPDSTASHIGTNEAALDAGEIFNPTFINVIKPFSLMRFMDWGNTNAATLYNNSNPSQPIVSNSGNWSDRPATSSAFWDGPNGVPIETEVALLNEVGSDGWFNLPVTASNDYMTQEATLVHNTLGHNEKAYIEFSNEVWNFGFTQIEYAEEQGEALWPSALTTIDPLTGSDYTAYDVGLNWYAVRASQMCDIWKGLWGADAAGVNCVMGTQAAGTSASQEELACPLWSSAPCATNHGIGALAIAPYFGYTVPDSWTSDPDGGLDKIFTEINSGGVTPAPNGAYPGGMIAQATSWVQPQKAIANSYGLKLVGYESGQSLVDTGDASTTPLYIAANRDPRMGSSTLTYLQDMQSAGMNFFNYYTDVYPANVYGSWGSMESLLSTSTPKYNALVDFVNTTPPSSDTTPPSTPSGLTATAISSSAINLSWNASTDNVGVQGYRIFRNGTQIASVASTTLSYGDTGLTPSTSYSYTVNAYDAAGNQSSQSSSASAMTGAPGLEPTFVGTGSLVHSGSAMIGTAASLGTATSTRFVIVAITAPQAANSTISSSTIAGLPATIDYQATAAGVEAVAFISALVPSGSSGDIVLNWSGTLYNDGTYAVYTINESSLASTTPTTGASNTAGGTSETPTVSATAGGFVLGAYSFNNASGKNQTIPGGFTADDANSSRGFFHLGSVGTTGTTAATISWTGTYSSQSALATWH